MELLDYLRAKGLEALKEEFHISVSRHKDYPNLCCLKYHMIESPRGHSIVDTCRGIVLDENEDWKVVSYSYNRFYNYGEGPAANISWFTADVLEKIDGSIIVMYPYKGIWQIASSGTPDASGNVNYTELKFSDLFWRVWNELKYPLPNKEIYSDLCFSFELCTMENRIVIPHPKSRIVLHGVRCINPPYAELEPDSYAEKHGWECIKSFPISTLEETLKAAKALDGISGEGFVVRDIGFNRVKIKSPAYLTLHQLKSNFSDKGLLDVIRHNEQNELLVYFPEFTEKYNYVSNLYRTRIEEAKQLFAAHSSIPNQKDFALKVKDHPMSGGLFALRAGKVNSLETWLSEVPIDRVVRMILE